MSYLSTTTMSGYPLPAPSGPFYEGMPVANSHGFTDIGTEIGNSIQSVLPNIISAVKDSVVPIVQRVLTERVVPLESTQKSHELRLHSLEGGLAGLTQRFTTHLADTSTGASPWVQNALVIRHVLYSLDPEAQQLNFMAVRTALLALQVDPSSIINIQLSGTAYMYQNSQRHAILVTFSTEATAASVFRMKSSFRKAHRWVVVQDVPQHLQPLHSHRLELVTQLKLSLIHISEPTRRS